VILPYTIRLLCLCFATFFVVHALSWLLVRGLSSTALRVAETMKPRRSSRFLFALRMAPAAVTLFLVLGFCVPSYVWLEPDITGERVGITCLLAAALGVAGWTLSLLRGLVSAVRTARYIRRCEADEADVTAKLVIVRGTNAVMAVAGVLYPRLLVSEDVMNTLNEEQRAAAFRHELAHGASRDNLKRLLFLLAPDVVPFAGSFSKLEKGWARFSEWAADDAAVDGDLSRALSLASALVRVAKLGAPAKPSFLLSSLIDDDRDLATRVNRLLCEPEYAAKPLAPLIAMTRNIVVIVGGIVFMLLLWPPSLGSVHRILERLVR
jgi:beta-lactamase regulating signal transducer with metallopeptidase domain